MKAMTYSHYGAPNILRMTQVERPSLGASDVLIRVHASTVTSGDWRLRASAFPAPFWLPARLGFGLFTPKHRILGSEVAGEIVSVGEDVTRFKVGDLVFGYCGYGSNAEYVAMPEDGVLVAKPDNVTFAEAAGIPNGALAALHFLRALGHIQSGQKVLINGASGGVGSYAVQIAKALGAHVTGVCSTRNVDMVRSLGADDVVDYKQQDFTKSGKIYDMILDTVGTTSHEACKASLTPRGVHLFLHFGVRELWQMFRTRNSNGQKVKCGVMQARLEDLELIATLVESGQLVPVIDREYPLGQTASAHAYVEQGHKRGSVVLTVLQEVHPLLLAGAYLQLG